MGNNEFWPNGDYPLRHTTEHWESSSSPMTVKTTNWVPHVLDHRGEYPVPNLDANDLYEDGASGYTTVGDMPGFYCFDGCRGHICMTKEEYLKHRRIIHGDQ